MTRPIAPDASRPPTTEAASEDPAARAAALRATIDALVDEYAALTLAPRPLVPGETAVPYAGRVFGAPELRALVSASLDGWITAGPHAEAFERALAEQVSVRSATLVNSGSSANLLALASCTSRARPRPLVAGDEVITAAAGFPTTVNPIVQLGCIPVFVDVELGTYNPSVDAVERAISPRTRAIMLAHTLGNPFDAAALRALADRHGLFLVEDACDALGSTLDGRPVGSFGDLATLSFYPAHHITTGEGGAVLCKDPVSRRIVESLRDWGRDCWCAPGHDDTCGKRYTQSFGQLPTGYDHKYVYTHLGYNLKATDLQAALGLAQLARLPAFGAARRHNFRVLDEALRPFEDLFVLPHHDPRADPSWFGYALTVRERAPFTKNDLAIHLESRRIGTRSLFGGNLLRQPAYEGVAHRVSGGLEVSDRVMRDTLLLGVYPGLDEARLGYVVETLTGYVRSRRLPRVGR